ncbi:hypothetical protein H2202_010958 [Exophiala xenobiotica]|nr:hypothetical protein H2202_010958 [Exophiala xenobiotica]KAK5215875.1 hypothetical protein LTR72_011085 [Exophiala xenobiotica]KAK5285093.1 hypothetical protein LTR14_011238 [Exophiala xenobiotica]KAK5312155.1 hypothetical protein LTR93_011443 [Exophiala xenobiotica]KAK5470009.1 hypothetical protein LTR55_011242 [Exophiala xenobiotica]
MARFSKKRSNVRSKFSSRELPKTKEEKESKAQYEQARRRQWCVVKKTNELHSLCNKKVFLLVVDDRRADFLSSEDISEEWPYSWQRLLSDPTVRRITYKTKTQTQHSDKTYPSITPNQVCGEVTPAESEDSEDSLRPIQSFLRVHELGRLLEQFHQFGRHRAAFLKGVRVALFGDSERLSLQEQV